MRVNVLLFCSFACTVTVLPATGALEKDAAGMVIDVPEMVPLAAKMAACVHTAGAGTVWLPAPKVTVVVSG